MVLSFISFFVFVEKKSATMKSVFLAVILAFAMLSVVNCLWAGGYGRGGYYGGYGLGGGLIGGGLGGGLIGGGLGGWNGGLGGIGDRLGRRSRIFRRRAYY